MTQTPKSTILIPLYIYPGPGAWEPLHLAIAANPTLNFIAIVNPNNGPGSRPWWPNADYVREILRLNAQPNVRTLGYVRTTYCRRPISDVFADIETYSGWPKDTPHASLGVHGIFFDETPNLFSEEVKTYLDDITKRVKESPGISDGKIVIHNPGTAVESRLADPGPDITTIMEETHAKYQNPSYQKWLATSPYDRSRSSYMVHSVPAGQVFELTRELRGRAEYVFVTDLAKDYYQSFGHSWNEFVTAMAEA